MIPALDSGDETPRFTDPRPAFASGDERNWTVPAEIHQTSGRLP
jgi:hypothetical protein